ncbi:hypothetical protein V8E36_008554 [Tilletia maclaganii]
MSKRYYIGDEAPPHIQLQRVRYTRMLAEVKEMIRTKPKCKDVEAYLQSFAETREDIEGEHDGTDRENQKTYYGVRHHLFILIVGNSSYYRLVAPLLELFPTAEPLVTHDMWYHEDVPHDRWRGCMKMVTMLKKKGLRNRHDVWIQLERLFSNDEVAALEVANHCAMWKIEPSIWKRFLDIVIHHQQYDFPELEEMRIWEYNLCLWYTAFKVDDDTLATLAAQRHQGASQSIIKASTLTFLLSFRNNPSEFDRPWNVKLAPIVRARYDWLLAQRDAYATKAGRTEPWPAVRLDSLRTAQDLNFHSHPNRHDPPFSFGSKRGAVQGEAYLKECHNWSEKLHRGMLDLLPLLRAYGADLKTLPSLVIAAPSSGQAVSRTGTGTEMTSSSAAVQEAREAEAPTSAAVPVPVLAPSVQINSSAAKRTADESEEPPAHHLHAKRARPSA